MIGRRIVHILLILLLVSFQFSLGWRFGLFTPQVILAILMAFSLTGNLIDSLWWATLGGLLLDLFIGSVVGMNLLTFSVISMLLILLTRQVLHRPTPTVAFIVFTLAALVYELAQAVVLQQLDWHLIFSAIVTASIALIGYNQLLRINKQREAIQIG